MLTETSAELRRRCALQLYDEWGGHYVLQQLICGVWCDVRPLSRDEAMTFRMKDDEALELIYPRGGRK